jgi:mono/diheme cytochrome c family protein
VRKVLKVAAGAIVTVLVVGGVALAWIGGRGFSAKEPPSALETFVARRVRSLAIPTGAREARNPVTLSPEVVARAMAHFADHCATCHANDGGGDTPLGRGLYPPPPDMRLPATQDLTDGELFYIIHNGIRLTGMPAFGGDRKPEDDTDSWELVHFIRTLPTLGPQQLEEMKQMNPRSPHEMAEEEAIRKFLAGEDAPPSDHDRH